jgi:hypothetical protein
MPATLGSCPGGAWVQISSGPLAASAGHLMADLDGRVTQQPRSHGETRPRLRVEGDGCRRGARTEHCAVGGGGDRQLAAAAGPERLPRPPQPWPHGTMVRPAPP